MSYIVTYETRNWDWISSYTIVENLDEIPKHMAKLIAYEIDERGGDIDELDGFFSITGIFALGENIGNLEEVFKIVAEEYSIIESENKKRYADQQKEYEEFQFEQLKKKLNK